MNNRIVSNLFFISVLMVTIVSCNNSEKDWGKAKATNTISGYEEFQKKHPSSDYSGPFSATHFGPISATRFGAFGATL